MKLSKCEIITKNGNVTTKKTFIPIQEEHVCSKRKLTALILSVCGLMLFWLLGIIF